MNRAFQRDEDGMRTCPAYIASSSARHQASSRRLSAALADFVAQIVGPAAEGIDVVKILMQTFGQQEGDDVEILVVVRGQPARVLLGAGPVVDIAQRLRPSRQTLWARAAALGYDSGLHVTVVAHQVPHHFQQVGERLHTVHEIARGDHAAAHKVQRFPDLRRRVVEAGRAGDFRIMQSARCPG